MKAIHHNQGRIVRLDDVSRRHGILPDVLSKLGNDILDSFTLLNLGYTGLDDAPNALSGHIEFMAAQIQDLARAQARLENTVMALGAQLASHSAANSAQLVALTSRCSATDHCR